MCIFNCNHFIPPEGMRNTQRTHFTMKIFTFTNKAKWNSWQRGDMNLPPLCSQVVISMSLFTQSPGKSYLSMKHYGRLVKVVCTPYKSINFKLNQFLRNAPICFQILFLQSTYKKLLRKLIDYMAWNHVEKVLAKFIMKIKIYILYIKFIN